MNHIGTKNIETNRLILRQFEKNDSSNMFKNWGSDSRVTEFLSWSSHENIKETDEILDSWILKYENDNTYNWAIELKDTQEVIGNIKVVKLEESNSSCEIGYCIGSGFWNRGITSEALESVIEFLFSKVHFNRIAAKHDVLNLASGVVMKKCNMIYEGTLRDVKFKNNRFCSLSVYSVLKNEWIEVNGKV
jgi:ribosomal-protein-alanine N-acetyltransferase